MSETLPPRPNLEQYKKLAKDLQEACHAASAEAIGAWAAHWAESLARLCDVKLSSATENDNTRQARGILERWKEFKASNEGALRCALTSAQLFIAREHGFPSWPRFAEHVDALGRERSPVANFEAAADAIVGGDAATLKSLLLKSPELIRQRSTRERCSTLLHYVSTNGVEDFRQKTPANIVEIARILLHAGVDVNATSDAYGGGSTALGLTATSFHPEVAGVQIELLELLIEKGAALDPPGGGSTVNDCLRNGRGRAAAFLANRGARLDLEGAAGAGHLDVAKTFFNGDGRLKPGVTGKQLTRGFTWACEFGRADVVRFLLANGMKADVTLEGGSTGLHWSAYEGESEIVQLLLEHGAAVDAVTIGIRERRLDGRCTAGETRGGRVPITIPSRCSSVPAQSLIRHGSRRMRGAAGWRKDTDRPAHARGVVRTIARSLMARRLGVPVHVVHYGGTKRCFRSISASSLPW